MLNYILIILHFILEKLLKLFLLIRIRVKIHHFYADKAEYFSYSDQNVPRIQNKLVVTFPKENYQRNYVLGWALTTAFDFVLPIKLIPLHNVYHTFLQFTCKRPCKLLCYTLYVPNFSSTHSCLCHSV